MDNGADDLGSVAAQALKWFHSTQRGPLALVQVDEESARVWLDELPTLVRRCYITDALLRERMERRHVSETDIIAACLPDPGATMSGDFGEILVYVYQAAEAFPQLAVGPKKWRLKQDRTKSAPHSDVVQFILPSWPIPSAADELLCSEVKTKSTSSAFVPIQAAIDGSTKDRTSRLARTLVWLRERLLLDDLGGVSIEQLDRFINATDYPEAKKRFRAVAVICSSLLTGELASAPTELLADCEVVVISVPNLHQAYSAIFAAAQQPQVRSPLPAPPGES